MKTKILAFLGTTFVILAFSGCDFFNSKEGQTSVITFPEGTTESYTIGTFFPEGATGQLVTINHKDNTGGADELKISYKVPDVNLDGVLNAKDCTGLSLLFNAIPITIKLTGIDPAVNDARTIWFGGDATGNCTNTTFTLQDGGPRALALSNTTPNIQIVSGTPGFIKYGTKAAPVSQYNLTGNSAEVKLISTYGQCSNGNVWNDATKACEAPAPQQPKDPNPGQVLNQNIVCYHKVNGSEYTGQYVKCGDYGCVYPNSTYCRDTGCYLNNGTPQWDSTINWDTITEFGVCRDAAGNPTGGTGGTANDWVKHTWKFSDGTEPSYILNRTDSEYFNYISEIDALCSNISKSQFQWKPNAGNDSYWKEFGIPDCTGGGVTPTSPPPPGQPSCYTEWNGSEQCEICTDEYGDVISEVCKDTNAQPADKKDAERQKKDMQKSLDQHKRDAEKEFPKFKKELERFKDKEFGNKIGKYEKLLKRATSAPKATEFLNRAIKWAKEAQGQLGTLISDMDALITSCQTGAQKTQALLDSMVPGQVSWDQLNSGWTSMRKNSESCWPLRDSIDFPYRAIEQHYYEFSDQIYEIVKATIEMESYGIEVPGFINEFFQKFEELQKWVTVGMSCRDNMKNLVNTLRNTTDPDDIEYAQQDIWDAQQDCSWERQDMQDSLQEWREQNDNNTWQKYVDRAWKVVDENRYVEEDKKVLLDIKFKIEALADLQSEVKTDDSFVLENLKNIERIRKKALPLVNEAIKAAETGDYVEWEQLDILKQVLRDSLNVIAEYCNRSSCDLSQEVRDIVYSEYYYPVYQPGQPGVMPPPPNFQDKFSTHFDEEFSERLAQIIADKIAAELIPIISENFTRLFNETIAEKIADYLEKGDFTGQNLTIVFNNSEFLGDDRTKIAVENSVELSDVLVEFENYDLSEDVSSLINEWKETVPAQNIKNDIVNKFKELLAAVRDGGDTGPIIASLKEKISDNEYRLATEDRIKFLDSDPFEGEWHAPYFVASSFQGDSDPNSGKLTGYVRPGGLINRCEALKIAIEASGIPKVSGATDWWCSTYVATAEKEGFSMVGYYGDSAYWVAPSTDRGYLAGNPTRAELCRLWVDVGNLEKSRYNNEFSDVDYLDPWAEDAATCKKYEIITGQDGKYFDAHGLANRAEVAAMEVRLQDALRANQLFNSLETGDNTGIFE